MQNPLAGRTVLALGSGLTLLGTVRVLSAAGAEVMVSQDVDPLVRRSRVLRSKDMRTANCDRQGAAGWLSAVPDGTVLIPCSDAWARALGALSMEARARHPASAAPMATLNEIVHKGRLNAVLDRLGLPHPQTRPLSSERDLDGFAGEQFLSVFIKPTESQRFFAHFGVKAFRIAGRDDAVRRLHECLDAGLDVVLQEYIPGPATEHYFIDGFVDRTGSVRARFARQRLRMFPSDFGNSSAMISVPLPIVDDAVRTLDALFEKLAFRGMFSAEFKRDGRDGRFKLLEINARAWWYVEFAARCGVDVCTLAVLDALDQPVADIRDYRVGRRCVYPSYDYHAIKRERAAGRLTLADWAVSWIGATQPVFRWNDPWPAWGEMLAHARRRLRVHRP